MHSSDVDPHEGDDAELPGAVEKSGGGGVWGAEGAEGTEGASSFGYGGVGIRWTLLSITLVIRLVHNTFMDPLKSIAEGVADVKLPEEHSRFLDLYNPVVLILGRLSNRGNLAA